MAVFIYRCPSIGLNVQGWIAGEPAENDEEAFEPVNCTVCSRVHLVNPKTGKVVGASDD